MSVPEDLDVLVDLTPYTGERASEQETTPVMQQEISHRLLITAIAGLPIAALLGLLWSPLLGLWAISVGFVAEVIWIFALHYISPFGLRQRQWRRWYTKITSASGELLHADQIIDQRFDDVRRFEASPLCRQPAGPAVPSLAHAFGHPSTNQQRRIPTQSGTGRTGHRARSAVRRPPPPAGPDWSRLIRLEQHQ